MIKDLPKLIGTQKQVKYANQLREDYIQNLIVAGNIIEDYLSKNNIEEKNGAVASLHRTAVLRFEDNLRFWESANKYIRHKDICENPRDLAIQMKAYADRLVEIMREN